MQTRTSIIMLMSKLECSDHSGSFVCQNGLIGKLKCQIETPFYLLFDFKLLQWNNLLLIQISSKFRRLAGWRRILGGGIASLPLSWLLPWKVEISNDRHSMIKEISTCFRKDLMNANTPRLEGRNFKLPTVTVLV